MKTIVELPDAIFSSREIGGCPARNTASCAICAKNPREINLILDEEFEQI
jgi:hypothetical protein